MGTDKNELRITNLNSEVIQKLSNIADNIGVTRSAFIKTELHNVVNKFPDHMKVSRPKKD